MLGLAFFVGSLIKCLCWPAEESLMVAASSDVKTLAGHWIYLACLESPNLNEHLSFPIP
jgi:hypothetical protein